MVLTSVRSRLISCCQCQDVLPPTCNYMYRRRGGFETKIQLLAAFGFASDITGISAQCLKVSNRHLRLLYSPAYALIATLAAITNDSADSSRDLVRR